MAQRIAHDIKNPLTSILLTLQRLQMEIHDKAPKLAQSVNLYINRIIERIELLRRMTRNFLKFIEVEQLNLVETDLTAFLEESRRELNKMLPQDIRLEWKLGEQLPRLRLDQEQFQVVLTNLISNAVNAMPNGGVITISTSFQAGLQLLSKGNGSGDYVVVEVMDTRVGIPESDLPHLFDPHFTSSDTGTGLGLAIVKKIVESHGGTIEVESEVGSGTSFSIYLPVNQEG